MMDSETISLTVAQAESVKAFLAGNENRSLTLGKASETDEGWFILERRDGRNALYIPALDQLLFLRGVALAPGRAENRLYFQFEGFDFGVLVDRTVPHEWFVPFEDFALMSPWISETDMADFRRYLDLPATGPLRPYIAGLMDCGFVKEDPDDDPEEASYSRSLGPSVKARCIPADGYDVLEVEGVFGDVDYGFAEDLGGPVHGLTFALCGGFELFIRAGASEEDGQ